MLIRTTAAAWALVFGLPAAAQHAGHGTPATAAVPSAAPATLAPTRAASAASASAPPLAASPPETSYQSAFEAYKRFTDEPVGSWKAANERVEQIGGWRSYAQESTGGGGGHAGHGGGNPASGQNPPPATAPRPVPSPTPLPSPAVLPGSQPAASPVVKPAADHSQHH